MNTYMYNYRNAKYSMTTSTERVDGLPVKMYGVRGKSGNDSITIPGLSEDSVRMKNLVENMNRSDLELCQLKDVVEDFLFESYGILLF